MNLPYVIKKEQKNAACKTNLSLGPLTDSRFTGPQGPFVTVLQLPDSIPLPPLQQLPHIYIPTRG